jgi:hypothetical protein
MEILSQTPSPAGFGARMSKTAIGAQAGRAEAYLRQADIFGDSRVCFASVERFAPGMKGLFS